MAARGKSPSKAASASRGSATRTPGQRRKVAGDAHRTSVKEREQDDAGASDEGDPSGDGTAEVSEDARAPEGDVQDGAEQASDEESPATGNRSGRRVVLVRALIAVLVVALLAAGGFGVSTYLMYNSDAARNGAVVDDAANRKVSDDVSRALQTAFSYDHGRPEATEREAREVLIGKAVEQYTQLFGQVKQVAPQQQLRLTSAVRTIGVTELEDGHARLLAFVDQQGLRGDNNQRRSGTAQLDVSARLVGDTWKVDDIKVL